MSVLPLPPDGFSWSLIFDVFFFSKNMSRKSKFDYNLTEITGVVHDDRHTFLIVSPWILLRMRGVSDKSFRENQNSHFMFKKCSTPLPRKSCRLWDNVGKYVLARQHDGWLHVNQTIQLCYETKSLSYECNDILLKLISHRVWWLSFVVSLDPIHIYRRWRQHFIPKH
jgi:hypothetical protein